MPLYITQSTELLNLPIQTVANDNDFVVMVDVDGTPYKITKADLLADLLNALGLAAVDLDFSTDGDTNGLFYYLGTSKGTTAWSNPSANNSIIVSASYSESGNPISLVDRQNSEWFSNNVANSWVGFQIQAGKLKCNHYSIKTRANNPDYYPRNWILKASNDGINWTVLDTQTDNTALNSVSQWLSLPVISTMSYSYFQLLQNGLDSSNSNYFCLGEVELYGTYYP